SVNLSNLSAITQYQPSSSILSYSIQRWGLFVRYTRFVVFNICNFFFTGLFGASVWFRRLWFRGRFRTRRVHLILRSGFGYRYGFRLARGFSFRLGRLVSSCFQRGLAFGGLLLSQLGSGLGFGRLLLSQFRRSLSFGRRLLSQLGSGIFSSFRCGRCDRRLCLGVHYSEITGGRYIDLGCNGVRRGLAGRGRGHTEAVESLLGSGEDVARLVEGPTVFFGLVARLAQAEAEAMAVVLDANDFDGEDVVLVDDFSGVVDAAVDELRNVDKAFDGPLQADKGAERCELRDLAGNNLSLAVVRNDFFPALGLCAPDANRVLLAFVVDLEHINGDMYAYREQLV